MSNEGHIQPLTLMSGAGFILALACDRESRQPVHHGRDGALYRHWGPPLEASPKEKLWRWVVVCKQICRQPGFRISVGHCVARLSHVGLCVQGYH